MLPPLVLPMSTTSQPEPNAAKSATAFAAFVDDVRRYVARKVDDPAARDDLVQEVFVRVHDRSAQLADDQRLAGWIRTITRNVIHDHYRRRRPTDPLPPQLGADAPEDDDGIRLDRALIGSWLMHTIERLPAPQRDVLTLTELQGLKQREAAARLGLSLPAVKARVRRGRAELLRRLVRCCHVELDAQGALMGYTPRDPCEAGSCCPASDDE